MNYSIKNLTSALYYNLLHWKINDILQFNFKTQKTF